MTRLRTSLAKTLVATLGVGLIGMWVLTEMKGESGMSQIQQTVVEDGQPFFFGRWTPNPKGPNPMIPRVDRSTIGAYADLMDRNEFGIGRLQAGQLVSLEEWMRDRTDPPAGITVAGKPIESLPVQPGEVRVFMQTAPDIWAEVAAEQTAGESLFIRLRSLPDLRTGQQVAVAEETRQYLMRRNTYHYGPDGQLIAVTREERDTGFVARRYSIGPDGGTVD